MKIPDRQPNAPTGTQIAQALPKSHSTERDAVLYRQLILGNIPSFLRKLVPITIEKNDVKIIYHVMPDYLSVGSDDDFFRVTIQADTAQAVANFYQMCLPTPAMVDQILEEAKKQGGFVSFTPSPVPTMAHSATMVQHSKDIDSRIKNPGQLMSGAKKDIVVGNESEGAKGSRLLIYGGEYENGKKVQEYSDWHNFSHQDYSNAIRLIDQMAQITIKDEQPKNMNIKDILVNKELCFLLSNRGVVTRSAYDTKGKDVIKSTEEDKEEQRQDRVQQRTQQLAKLMDKQPQESSESADQIASEISNIAGLS